MSSLQKLGLFLLNKVLQKIVKIENHFTENCSSSFIFLTENHFQKDLGGFWASKFTLKTENAQFLRTLHQVLLKDIEKSSQYVTSGVKIY